MDTELRKIIDSELNKTVKKISPRAKLTNELTNKLNKILKDISPRAKLTNQLTNKLTNSLKDISPKAKLTRELSDGLNKIVKNLSPKTKVSREVIYLFSKVIREISPKTEIPNEVYKILEKNIKKISPKSNIPTELNNIINNSLNQISPKKYIPNNLDNLLNITIKKVSPASKIPTEINNEINNQLNKISPKIEIPVKLKDLLNIKLNKLSSKRNISSNIPNLLVQTIKKISSKKVISNELKQVVNKIIKNESLQNVSTPELNEFINYKLPKNILQSNVIDKPKNSLLNMKYDYIIIGGGPTGLTLAWYLGKTNKKVLIIEKERTLGGCHRVQRVDGLFTEHGPRVYSNSYVNFIDLLSDMELNFYDLFTEYDFDLSNIGKKTKYDLSKYELACFTLAMLKLSLVPNYGKDKSIKTFMNQNEFSEKSKDYIDRVCRLTDGATSDKYTLFQFLQLANQQVLYKLYQPKLPNDRGLIKLWEEKLLSNKNIDILLNHDVIKLNINNNIITSLEIKDRITQNQYKMYGKNIILTIPPKPLINLLKDSKGCENAFGDIKLFEKWGLQNSYFDYIPITLHWNDKIKLPKIQGFPYSDWGLAFIVLSNYMEFNDNIELKKSNLVISTCITFPEKISKKINKTAHQCTMQEIYDEVLVQLRIVYPDLPMPDRMIVSPQVYRNENTKKWVNIDTAYVATNENTIIPNDSKIVKNFYNCGTHNGNSHYHFTSIESAVSNGKFLANKLESKLNLNLRETAQITTYLYFSFMLLIVLIYIKLFGNFIW